MKNKTLPILLLIPFVVALLAFVSISAMENRLLSDITDIVWSYNDLQTFKINENQGYALEATAEYKEGASLAYGSADLEWFVYGLDNGETNVAKIVTEGDNYFLYALNEGKCKVVCSNKRKSKSKYFTAQIFDFGVIAIMEERSNGANSAKGPGNKVYGEYDFDYSKLELDSYKSKTPKFNFSYLIECENEVTQNVVVTDKSWNIDVTPSNGQVEVTIRGAGDAYFKLSSVDEPSLSETYSFKIIDDGYNIYSYDDLLMATNYSSVGEIAVLQINLQSIDGTYENKHGTLVKKNNNTELLGHLNSKTQSCDFSNDVYKFETTYNHEFIEQYTKETNTEFDPIVLAGIHVQKDFHGNGYSLNFHELAYPTEGKSMNNIGDNGKLMPGPNDLFKGPLPFVTIGPLDENFTVKALGQDNCGIYIDGDNITFDDVTVSNTDANVKNAKTGQYEDMNIYDLTYSGTVIDVRGKNNKITNSIIQYGKTAVRAFDADGFMLDNCILAYSCEFLLKVGSNDYAKPDTSKKISYEVHGEKVNKSFSSYFDDINSSSYTANAVYGAFVANNFGGRGNSENSYMQLLQGYATDAYASYSDAEMVTLLEETQKGLDNDKYLSEPDNMVVNNTYFYQSGIFSIAFDTNFNGGYLYDGLPSLVKKAFDMLGSVLGKSVFPHMIGGTSRPVNLSLTGNTDFYDWKDLASLDVSSIIDENISSMIHSLGKDFSVSIDDFFPIKSLLIQELKKRNAIYTKDGKQYANTKIAYYGGGLNSSSFILGEKVKDVASEIPIDLVGENIKKADVGANDLSGLVLGILSKAVLMAIGTNPFKFVTNDVVNGVPELFGKNPDINDLQKNYLEGENV